MTGEQGHADSGDTACVACPRARRRALSSTGTSPPAAGSRSIINFGEDLPEAEISAAFANHERADVCLAMGSSLRVTPAADAPEACASAGGKLVIVNIQKTPLDRSAALVIHAMCDTVAAGLAERLGLTVPPFRLRRRVRVCFKPDGARQVAELSGLGLDDTPFALVTRLWARTTAGNARAVVIDDRHIMPVTAGGSKAKAGGALPYETWRVKIPDEAVASAAEAAAGGGARSPTAASSGAGSDAAGAKPALLELVCSFSGNYREPLARISVPVVSGTSRTVDLTLTPGEAQWDGGDGAVDPRFRGWGSAPASGGARPAVSGPTRASPASRTRARAAGARLAKSAASGAGSTARPAPP